MNTDNKEKCRCPLCNQSFIPEDGLTAEEYLAKGIIKAYSEIQRKNPETSIPCPRCGKNNMLPGFRNALSRGADISICPACGTDEALRDLNFNPLPLTEWYAVKEILRDFKKE